MLEDNALIGTGFIIIALVVLITEILVRRRWLNSHIARYLLHSISIATAAIVAYQTHNLLKLKWTSGVVSLLVILVVQQRWLSSDAHARKSWGIAFFAVGYTASLLSVPVVPGAALLFSWLVVALADPMAAIVGRRWGRRRFVITSDVKTPAGFLAFFTVSVLLQAVWNFLPGMPPLPWAETFDTTGLLAVLGVSVLLALAEITPSRGSDNVWIPAMALSVWVLFTHQNVAMPIAVAVCLSGVAVLAAWRMHWLTSGGSMAAWLLGIVVLVFGGWPHAVLILIFLVSGSLMSRAGKTDGATNTGNGRNGRQVYSNGLIAGGILVFMAWIPASAGNIVYAGVIAAITADTWSSETGTTIAGPTIDLIRFRSVRPGLSGGVSLAGTVGAITGSAIIALTSSFLLADVMFWPVFLLGITGMLLDSLLGSSVQRKYRADNLHALVDEPEEGAKASLVRGWQFIDNHRVNEIMTWLTAIIGWWFFG